jgi:hypothetical protein
LQRCVFRILIPGHHTNPSWLGEPDSGLCGSRVKAPNPKYSPPLSPSQQSRAARGSLKAPVRLSPHTSSLSHASVSSGPSKDPHQTYTWRAQLSLCHRALPNSDAKLCRMCDTEIEIPHHVLLRCTAHRETSCCEKHSCTQRQPPFT